MVDEDEDEGQDDPNEYQLEMMDEKGEKFHCIQRERAMSDSAFEDPNNYISQYTLTLPAQLNQNQNFARFFHEFNNNIDYILKYVYKLLPQTQTQHLSNSEKTRLTQKYDNLLIQSKEMCKRFTGPHSVL